MSLFYPKRSLVCYLSIRKCSVSRKRTNKNVNGWQIKFFSLHSHKFIRRNTKVIYRSRFFLYLCIYFEFTDRFSSILDIKHNHVSILVSVHICYLCNCKHFPWRLLSSAVLFFSGDRCNVDLFDLCVKEGEGERYVFAT